RQFVAGSRKLTEDENAILIIPGCHELLGYKIHAVVQGSHETEIRCLVKGFDFAMAVVPAVQDDRLPAVRFQTAVDAVGLRLYRVDEILVTLDTRAAGSPELNEAEPLTIIRIFIQKTFDATKPLQKPFRVIDAIHAHSEKQDIPAQPGENLRSILL